MRRMTMAHMRVCHGGPVSRERSGREFRKELNPRSNAGQARNLCRNVMLCYVVCNCMQQLTYSW